MIAYEITTALRSARLDEREKAARIALTCSECGHLFDGADSRAYRPQSDSEYKPLCPWCCQMRLHGTEAWAVWNDCQGIFSDDIHSTKKDAEAALPGYGAGGCKVVPIRCFVEPEEEWWRRDWTEAERERDNAASAIRARGMKLSERQREIAAEILREGRVSISLDSTPDYIDAAAFIFDNGLLYNRAAGLRALSDSTGDKKP